MIPWLRFFASTGARELSAAIERSRPEDQIVASHARGCRIIALCRDAAQKALVRFDKAMSNVAEEQP